MILIEIALTIAAWKRGWRWRALLPMVFALVAGFLIGIAVGASGGTIEQAAPAAVVAELGVVAVLIYMVARKPADAVARPAIQSILAPPIPKA